MKGLNFKSKEERDRYILRLSAIRNYSNLRKDRISNLDKSIWFDSVKSPYSGTDMYIAFKSIERRTRNRAMEFFVKEPVKLKRLGTNSMMEMLKLLCQREKLKLNSSKTAFRFSNGVEVKHNLDNKKVLEMIDFCKSNKSAIRNLHRFQDLLESENLSQDPHQEALDLRMTEDEGQYLELSEDGIREIMNDLRYTAGSAWENSQNHFAYTNYTNRTDNYTTQIRWIG